MLLGLLHKAGCYVESDPIGLQDRLNTYGYVSANLLLKTDPRGLIEWSAMYGVTRTRLGRFGAAVKIRLLILLVMLLLDVTYFYIFKSKWVYGADHSSLLHVIFLQGVAIIDITLNFKISIFCLGSLGLYKQYREYGVIALIFLFSYLSFHTAIIGTDEWGRECTYPSCIEKARNGTLKIN